MEIADLHSVSVELQEIVSGLGSGVPQRAQTALARIQRLDRLTQELEDLGPLLARLASLASENEEEQVVEAIREIKLVTLRDRISCRGMAAMDFSPGEPELF